MSAGASGPRGPELRLGLLGCADIATRRILPAVRDTAGVRLTAVGSRSPARAAEVARDAGAEGACGYEELLERPDVDAVYLPLPPALHARWTRRALEAGKHVLAEKPLTTTVEDTAALLRLARERGLVLRENYMFVEHPLHRRVLELTTGGAIGTVHGFAAEFGIPARPHGDIRLRRDLGGGALLDVGGYPIRAARLFLGDGLSVVGACLRVDPGPGVDVAGSALLGRADGVTASLGFGLDHHYRSGYRFWGSEGVLTAAHVFTTPAHHRPVITLERGGDPHAEEVAPYDHVRGAVAAFARSVADGPEDDGDGAGALAQARLVADVARAAGRDTAGPEESGR